MWEYVCVVAVVVLAFVSIAFVMGLVVKGASKDERGQ